MEYRRNSLSLLHYNACSRDLQLIELNFIKHIHRYRAQVLYEIRIRTASRITNAIKYVQLYFEQAQAPLTLPLKVVVPQFLKIVLSKQL